MHRDTHHVRDEQYMVTELRGGRGGEERGAKRKGEGTELDPG